MTERHHLSDRDLRHPRAYPVLVACVMTGAGSLMMLAEHPRWGLPYVLLLVSGALGVAGAGLGRLGAAPARRVVADGARVTVRFRRLMAVGLALGGIATASLFGTTIPLVDGEPLFWVLAICSAAELALTAVFISIALRGCRVTLDPDGIELVTWFEDGWVAWADLRSVTLEKSSMWVVRLRADPAATGLQRRRTRLALTERHGSRASFVLHTLALDDPLGLVEVIERLRALDRDGRRTSLSHGVPEYLRQDLHADYLLDLRTRPGG